MNISFLTAQKVLTLVALVAIAIGEIWRPGLVGAPINLGVLVAVGAVFLAIKKAPPEDPKGA